MPPKAVVPGFEPGQRRPKCLVLPLHHTTVHLGSPSRLFLRPRQRKITQIDSLCNKQVIILLAALQNYVAVINQIGCSNGT